jgi:alpha-amylase
MTSVCLYFRVHQPYRLRKYQQEDITVNNCYEDNIADSDNINRMADHCYLPANEILYRQINTQQQRFNISFSISGTALELLMKYRPDVIQSFKRLAAAGCVEFLAETYYHSLSSLHSPVEFQRQVRMHGELIKRLFDQDAVIFRNTELIHNNRIAEHVDAMNLKGILCEGTERILKERSTNQVYTAPGNTTCPLLLRNACLSDDIAFRFDDTNWTEHPLTPEKFAEWLHSHPDTTDVINLFMDYETFGIHKKEESGIFDFLDSLPAAVLKKEGWLFSTPSQALQKYLPADIYDVPQTISWEDNSDTSCVWCENVMQHNTLKKIYSIEPMVQQGDCEKSQDTWGRLQSADHFYYMTERKANSAKYLNPFTTAREAFQNYSNLVTDFEISLIKKEIKRYKKYPSTVFANTIF